MTQIILFCSKLKRKRPLPVSDLLGLTFLVVAYGRLDCIIVPSSSGFSLEAGNRRTPAATFDISAAYFC